MNAGKLRHRVEIQQSVTTQDSYGAPVNTWKSLGPRWASIEPLSGRELILAQQAQSEATIRVRMRYTNDLTTGCRILYGSRTFEVNSIIDKGEKHVELEVMCKEKN